MFKLTKTYLKLPRIRRKQAVHLRSAEVLQNHYRPTLGNAGRHKDTSAVSCEGVSFAETKNKANFNPIEELRKSLKSSNKKVKFYGGSGNTVSVLKNKYTPDQQKLQESDYVFSPYHNKITYIGECANIEDLPSQSEGLNKKLAPEIAVIGSTNAGKSTFLKQLLRFNQRERNVPISSDKLAETKRLRYWQLGKTLSIVDTPGFGLNQPDCVNTTLIPYLANRKNLKHIIFLIAVSQEDKSLETFTDNHVRMLKLLSDYRSDSYSIVLNKVDLFERTDCAKAVYDMSRLVHQQKLGNPDIFVTSGKTGRGMALMRSFLLDKVEYFQKNPDFFRKRENSSMNILKNKK